MDGKAYIALMPSPPLHFNEALLLLGLTATICLFLAVPRYPSRSLNAKADFTARSIARRASKSDDYRSSSGTVTKESDFPEGWWTSEDVLSLERRAIFSKQPIAIARMSMFQTPGTYHTIDHPAGYPLFLILGRDKVLRGFHNVCRHRAYPVVSTKKTGCTFVLGCKYHGWSYDLKGNLVKAPKFDHLESFDKKANSLLEVNVVVAASGLVFVDAGALPNRQATTTENESRKHLAETWDTEGEFNWKLAEAEDAFSLPSLDKSNKAAPSLLSRFAGRVASSSGTQRRKPSVLTTVIDTPEDKLTTMIQIYPVSAEKSRLTISLYASSLSASPSRSFVNGIKDEFRQAISRLENEHSLAKETSNISNESHQMTLLDSLKSHQRLERASDRQIWPASELFNQTKTSEIDLDDAEKLFRELESVTETCGGNDVRKEDTRASSIAW